MPKSTMPSRDCSV